MKNLWADLRGSGLELVLTVRDPSGAVLDRSTIAETGEMLAWLERLRPVVEAPGVTVDLETLDGRAVGRLTDDGFALTPLGALPLVIAALEEDPHHGDA